MADKKYTPHVDLDLDSLMKVADKKEVSAPVTRTAGPVSNARPAAVKSSAATKSTTATRPAASRPATGAKPATSTKSSASSKPATSTKPASAGRPVASSKPGQTTRKPSLQASKKPVKNEDMFQELDAKKSSKIVERYAEKENPRDVYLREVRKKASANRGIKNDSKVFTKSNYVTAKVPPKPKKWTDYSFYIGLGIYALILIICAGFFLRYADKCLVKHENSQPENAMKSVIAKFEGMIADGSIKDTINASATSEFEDKDIFKNMYLETVKNAKNINYKKNENSYSTEAPIYDVLNNDQLLARITLKATNQETIFGILTIMDWDIDKIEPALSASTKNYTFTVDKNATVTVNGIELSESYRTGEPVMNAEYANTNDYYEMPATVTYKINNLVNVPEVKVTMPNGEVTDVAFDEDCSADISSKYEASEMPTELKNMALDMAKTWDNFMTRDLTGANYGLATAQKLFIKNSYYYDMAKSWAYGIDITLTSDHTLEADCFKNVVVDNYIKFSDNCFSCHIAFDKHLKLRRQNDSLRINKMDSTFYFLNYDDTDDGVNNPRWVIVDMQNTTK